ncbi:predicted protein, partial [Nematostella vectensis]
ICVVNGILSPSIVVVNLMVFVAILRKPRLRTASNTSILCLATTDLIVGLLAQPAFVVFQASKLRGNLNKVPCFEILIARFLEIFCIGYSFLTLNLMTVERYLAVFHPFWYHEKVTSKAIILSSFMCWTIWTALFLGVRLTLGINSHEELIITSGTVAATLILTSLVYYKIFKLARSSVNAVDFSNADIQKKLRETKAARTVVIVTGTVFLCCCP